MYRLLFLMLMFAFPIHAQDTVSGDIGNRIFEPAKGPFIIKEDITVPEGQATIIKAGCVFLFQNFSGIIVKGSLSVNGTPESLVVFTSYTDQKYVVDAKDTAKPFDWNGIFIAPQAGDIHLSDFLLVYSVYGIKSKKEDIFLNNAQFKASGQFHFTIKDKIQDVTDGVPFNYQKTPEEKIKVNANPVERNGFGKPIPLIVGATGVVTGVTAIITFVKMGEAKKDYRNEVDPVRQKELEKKYNANRAAGIVCTGVSAICLPLSAMLFIKNKKSVSVNLSPILGHETGIALAIDF